MGNVRPLREPVDGKVAEAMRKAVDEAIKEKAIGFVLVYETPADYFMSANVQAKKVREYLGLWEADAKPTLSAIVRGD